MMRKVLKIMVEGVGMLGMVCGMRSSVDGWFCFVRRRISANEICCSRKKVMGIPCVCIQTSAHKGDQKSYV